MTVHDEDVVEAYYMYSLLDYHTYNLFFHGTWIGQVTLNDVDRSVGVRVTEMGVDPYRLGRIGNYAAWRSWLKSHIRPNSAQN